MDDGFLSGFLVGALIVGLFIFVVLIIGSAIATTDSDWGCFPIKGATFVGPLEGTDACTYELPINGQLCQMVITSRAVGLSCEPGGQ